MSGRAAAALAILAVGLATVRCSHAPRSTCTTFLESPQLRPCAPARAKLATPMFHGDRARLGWNAAETILTPSLVGSSRFGATWSSPPFDDAQLDDGVSRPHMYASPLYVDGVTISGGDHGGRALSIVVAATSNAWVYAVNAFTDCSATPTVDAGTILWRTRLGTPKRVEMDGRMPLGVLSTPVIDLEAIPPRLYVVSVDATIGFQAFALDLASGAVLVGWPVTIDDPALRPINVNGPALFAASGVVSQRGALALSPKGDRLYVPFGAYNDGGTGWLVSIDTRRAALASAFSMAPWSEPSANGGMWGAGGPAIDANGVVYGTTGNSPDASANAPATWGNSLLAFAPGDPLALAGAYSPWNRCLLDAADIDIGAGSPMIVPDLDPAATSTPHLVAFGGKQGNVYLVDRDRLAPRTQRTACTSDSASDLSLLPPAIQPPLGARGPLNVFGPSIEEAHRRRVRCIDDGTVFVGTDRIQAFAVVE